MRLLVAAAVAGTFLALPSGALAQGGTALCVGPKSSAEAAGQAALLPYLGNRSAEAAASAALGAQYVGSWWDARHQGWAVALSPGALDVETGKAAILAELTARFPPDAAALLSSTLAVYPTRYSGTELVAAHEHVIAMAVAQPDFVTGHGISCHDSDAYRVLVWIGPEATPEVVARATALFGGLGDIVRLEYGRPVVPLAGTVPAVPGDKEPCPVRDRAEGGPVRPRQGDRRAGGGRRGIALGHARGGQAQCHRQASASGRGSRSRAARRRSGDGDAARRPDGDPDVHLPSLRLTERRETQPQVVEVDARALRT